MAQAIAKVPDIGISPFLWMLQTGRAMSQYLGKNVSAPQIPHPEMLEVFQLSQTTIDKLLACYAADPRQPFSDKYDSKYQAPSAPNPPKMYEEEMPHIIPSEETMAVLREAIAELRPGIQERLLYNFSVVNLRFFEVLPGRDYEWHADHFPTGIYKVLVYLTGTSKELGTTYVRIGDTEYALNLPPGAALLFDSNNLIHRAVSPQPTHDASNATRNAPKGRITVEFTIAPSLFPSNEIPQPGLIATYPAVPPGLENYLPFLGALGKPAPKSQSNQLEQMLNNLFAARKNWRALPTTGINIGGGPYFAAAGWANLDGAFGPANQDPFKFSAKCHFPFDDGALTRAYTSHTFEHLPDTVVYRVLSETYRVLASGGRLLVKIPDFDGYRQAYVAGNFEPYRRITRKVEHFWPRRNVKTTDLVRLCFMHCNFWNKAYAVDHYEAVHETNDAAFFGPVPIQSDEAIANIVLNHTPHETAMLLRRLALQHEPDLIFGHQNAWSTLEMTELVESFGFKVISTNRDEIINACRDWPEVAQHFDVSMWVLCERQ